MIDVNSAFGALNVVLRDYIELKRQRAGPNLIRAGEVIEAWLSAKSQGEAHNEQFGTFFNPFFLAPLKETIHSRILGDLLNPRGGHGQRAIFLCRLLQYLEIPEPKAGDWQLTVEGDRVDLMLTRAKPTSIILIENKANDAQDQPNQLYRYWHRQVYRRFPKLDYHALPVLRSFRVIYLSGNGKKQPEAQSLERPNGWEGVNPNYPILPLPCELLGLDRLLTLLKDEADRRVPKTNARLRSFLEMYSELWNL